MSIDFIWSETGFFEKQGLEKFNIEKHLTPMVVTPKLLKVKNATLMVYDFTSHSEWQTDRQRASIQLMQVQNSIPRWYQKSTKHILGESLGETIMIDLFGATSSKHKGWYWYSEDRNICFCTCSISFKRGPATVQKHIF